MYDTKACRFGRWPCELQSVTERICKFSFYWGPSLTAKGPQVLIGGQNCKSQYPHLYFFTLTTAGVLDVTQIKIKTNICIAFFVGIVTSKALRMARTNEGSHSFTCHQFAYPRVYWAILLLMPSCSASPHFGRYSFPFPQRVVLVYKCLHQAAPIYLSELCIPVATFAAGVDLRSAVKECLVIGYCRTKNYAQRSFSYSGPTLWNSLPLTVRDPSMSLLQFCARLKTEMFCRAYDWSQRLRDSLGCKLLREHKLPYRHTYIHSPHT